MGIASKNGSLGNAYLSLGEYKKAIMYYQKGLEISSAIGDQAGVACKNVNLGNAYRNLGEYEKAIAFLMKGLKVSAQICDPNMESSSLRTIGLTYFSEAKSKFDNPEAFIICLQAVSFNEISSL